MDCKKYVFFVLLSSQSQNMCHMWLSVLWDVYVTTLIPLAVFGAMSGVIFGVVTEADCLWNKLKFVIICILVGVLSGILWPAVWFDKMHFFLYVCIAMRVQRAAAERAARAVAKDE